MRHEKEHARKSRVESHNYGGMKIEHHHDNEMHKGHHEMAHGHMDRDYHEMHKMGGLMPESQYEGIRGMPMGEVHRLEKAGAGRMARQYRQREAMEEGKDTRMPTDDTVYGRLPPIPGTIDS